MDSKKYFNGKRLYEQIEYEKNFQAMKKKGYVLMLDILGFKEYTEEKYDDFLSTWKTVKKRIQDICEEHKKVTGSVLNVDTLFMSDTILICISPNHKLKNNMSLYGIIIILYTIHKILLDCMVEYKIFLRGAVSYGDFVFSESDNMVMGKALNEAAEWYEAVDWIGVILSPSAEYAFELFRKQDDVNGTAIAEALNLGIVNYSDKMPLKDGYPKVCSYAIKWFDVQEINEVLDKLYIVFSDIRHSPVFASKYKNCIEFVRYCEELEKKKKKKKQSNEGITKTNGSPQSG